MKIRLFCAAGMSTSVLVKKIKEAGVKRGLELEVDALPVSNMKDKSDGIDVVLLGPQVSYELNNAKTICDPKNIPVGVINMMDYGMMNGDKVLDAALKLAEK